LLSDIRNNMIFTNQQIEAITASVLRELASRGVAVAPTSSFHPTPTATPAADPVEGLADGVGLKDRVVTEGALIAVGAAGQKISLPVGAIITPSGHDYIRRNGVTIINGTPSTVTSGSGLLIVIGNSNSAVSAASTAQWQVIKAGCEFDAARKATKKHSSPIVCTGGEPSVTACLVNRNADIRAAVVTQNTDIKLLISVMNPQVFCLDSSGWTFAALLRLFRTLTNVGSAPAGWRELT
jgi:hypothetical protein